jgi:soluble lytic murein transglycosylase-like protein
MIRYLLLATTLLALAVPASSSSAQHRHRHHHTASLDANGNLDAMISSQAAAYGVPEELVRRVIRRESGGNPRVVSAGNYGLMQIKLGTARALGYQGDAAGLLDPNTNMTYAVKYLAGAYHVAGGNADRAVHYYASGYYYAAKRKGTVGSNGYAMMDNRRQASANGASAAFRSDPVTDRPDYY